MLNDKNAKVFRIISVIPVALFGAIMFLLVKNITKENIAENICIIVLCLISFVLSNALNLCLYSVRKGIKDGF